MDANGYLGRIFGSMTSVRVSRYGNYYMDVKLTILQSQHFSDGVGDGDRGKGREQGATVTVDEDEKRRCEDGVRRISGTLGAGCWKRQCSEMEKR